MEPRKHISGCQGLVRVGRKQRDEKAEYKKFRALEIFCMTVMIDTHHYTFVHNHRTYNTKSELECKTMDFG